MLLGFVHCGTFSLRVGGSGLGAMDWRGMGWVSIREGESLYWMAPGFWYHAHWGCGGGSAVLGAWDLERCIGFWLGVMPLLPFEQGGGVISVWLGAVLGVGWEAVGGSSVSFPVPALVSGMSWAVVERVSTLGTLVAA